MQVAPAQIRALSLGHASLGSACSRSGRRSTTYGETYADTAKMSVESQPTSGRRSAAPPTKTIARQAHHWPRIARVRRRSWTLEFAVRWGNQAEDPRSAAQARRARGRRDHLNTPNISAADYGD